MSLATPEVVVGSPLRADGLVVFPLFAVSGPTTDYVLASEALKQGTVTVQEVDEAGSVPELIVQNRGDIRVLFLEGEALIGAKQNRVINTSVLVPAKSELRIPVSCVEQGRWRYTSKDLSPAPHSAPAKLRHTLKSSVSRSLDKKEGHRSDQGKVWEIVEHQQVSLSCSSETSALSDTFQALSAEMEETHASLPYIEGAIGLAIAIGSKLASVDLFGKSSTCAIVWRRILSGTLLDAAEAKASSEHAVTADVESLLAAMRAADWKQVDAVGEGEEMRTELKVGFGSVLSCNGSMVHASVVLG